MAGYQTIAVETCDSVTTVTLNRPEVLNAFNEIMSSELTEALKNLARDEHTRAVILTGAGRAFSSGQDLAELKAQYQPGFIPVLGRRLRSGYNPLIRAMRELEKPIIGAINGVAAGAGCSVALACDLRIASEKASIIEVFINVGLVPDSGSTFFLPRLVGMGKAAELCFTGDKVSADEALRLGLVNRIVSVEQLMPAAMEWAKRLASLPTRAIGLTKRLLNQSMQTDLAGQLEAEAFAQESAGKTADHLEGVMAFLDKRPSRIQGVMINVGVIGAGTMGAGIAQVAASSGCQVWLRELDSGVAHRARESMGKRLDRLVEKGKLASSARDHIMDRVHVAEQVSNLSTCDLIIEAIIEDLATKVTVLSEVKNRVPEHAVFASNTSSLSIAKIGDGIGAADRTVGMHFFNPAPLMPLVEVISGPRTHASHADRVEAIAKSWGKTVVRAKDTPGFIVNRVARGYYLEALRMLGEGVSNVADIDRVMTQECGFRMGPFELMDLVGIDVNYAVSKSVWEQMGQPAHETPSHSG